MGSATLTGGWWYRASRYEIRDGVIRPAADATLEAYDPWVAHVPASRRRRHEDWRKSGMSRAERPYQGLLRLAAKLHYRDAYLAKSELSGGEERLILDWCSSNGLLGILPHQVETVQFPPAKLPEPASQAREETDDEADDSGQWHGYQRTSLGWTEIRGRQRIPASRSAGRALRGGSHTEVTSRVRGTVPTPVTADLHEGGVVMRSLPDGVLHREDLHGEWSLFFDRGTDATTWPFPSFADEKFWRIYGEPVAWFVDVASLLGDALRMIEHFGDQRPATAPGREAVRSAFEQINALALAASPAVWSDAEAGAALRWTTPSLLASYAVMTQIDLVGSGTVRVCGNCGAPFITTTTWAENCSRSCRLAQNKRTQRKRQAEALRLAAEGVPIGRIVSEVQAKDAATVRGWIDKARAEGRLQ